VNGEQKSCGGACSLLRGPSPDQCAHQDAEIEAGDMDQVALVDVFPAAQPCAAHAAAIEGMGEAALDVFAAPAHGVATDAGFQSRPVGVDGLARCLVTMPAQIALGGLRFGNARFPDTAVELLQPLA